jgi:hypothetical protein
MVMRKVLVAGTLALAIVLLLKGFGGQEGARAPRALGQGVPPRTAFLPPRTDLGPPRTEAIPPTTSLVRPRPGPPWPRGPSELDVRLAVIEALEDGPVICEVTLKNISSSDLQVGAKSGVIGGFCRPEAKWRIRTEPSRTGSVILGAARGHGHPLAPGETVSMAFNIHRGFLSVPAGKVPLRFGWEIYRTADPDKPGPGKEFDLLFKIERTETIEVRPATAENVAAARRRLESELNTVLPEDRLEKRARFWIDCPVDRFLRKVVGCRHKEFVPLMLQAIDRGAPTCYRGRDILGSVYESFATPEEGFAACAEYLATGEPAAAADLFEYWTRQEADFQEHLRREEKLKKSPPGTGGGTGPGPERLEEELWKTSKRHLDTRLTRDQGQRLLRAPNVCVRALLYSYHPDWCPDAWIATLEKDLHEAMQPPRHLEELLARLDDDRFAVRERASAELLRAGPLLVGYLREVKQERLPPETRRRLELALAALGEPRLPRLWQDTVSRLTSEASPACRKMVDILLAGDNRSPIARAAREQDRERYERDVELKKLWEEKERKLREK